MHEIKKGLNVPLAGMPKQSVVDGPKVGSVGLVADDYVGMKPTMLVQVGDRVKLGQPVFEDKKTSGVLYTSPGAGTVQSINRGAKRKFESIVIELDGDDQESFETFADENLAQLDREKVVANLVTSGLWTAFRTRPYSKVPAIDSEPHSIFVTAIDTSPLAVDPAIALKEPDWERYFVHGLQVISRLTSGCLHLCKARSADIPVDAVARVTEFAGPHPAGLAGTHIHLLDPVNEQKTVWHIGYQDVVAIGCLFLEGRLLTDRIVSVSGPGILDPKIVRTRVGAALENLITGNTAEGAIRVVSGSALSGRTIAETTGFLGRYHTQLTAISDEVRRELLGWALPGLNKFSITRAFASNFASDDTRTSIPFTTSAEGSHRAIVPIGTYEKVVPLDIVPTALLKSLLVNDTETAQMLGCLELDEEDLALCTFVCPGKNEYGPLLRRCLTHIEHEG
ncbi:MAG: Na(+)-translocating NADH-quinone reductase subunit A [Planctomycetales bacterium]|nr:Na(+)-translocating NADH-quinone reductase subunit A [Planctomycetales bacterium]